MNIISWNVNGLQSYLKRKVFDPIEDILPDVIRGVGVPELDTEGRVLTVDMGKLFVVNTYVLNSQKNLERRKYRRDWDEAYSEFLARHYIKKEDGKCHYCGREILTDVVALIVFVMNVVFWSMKPVNIE